MAPTFARSVKKRNSRLTVSLVQLLLIAYNLKQMIYLIYGDNDYQKEQAVAKIVSKDDLERRDGETIDEASLRDVLFGLSLFESNRPVLISGLSQNDVLWQKLPEILAAEVDKTVLLVDSKVDKRSKTYKWLQKNAEVAEYVQLIAYQRAQLMKWLEQQAKEQGVILTTAQQDFIIDRLGFDQMRLVNFIRQLSLAGEVDDQLLELMLPLAKSENIFGLFEASLDGDIAKVQSTIKYLEQTSDSDGAFMTMGLLASQAVNLSALVLSGGYTDRVVADFGVKPFALKGLSRHFRRVNHSRLRRIIGALHNADTQMKSTNVSPWLLIELALINIAKDTRA